MTLRAVMLVESLCGLCARRCLSRRPEAEPR